MIAESTITEIPCIADDFCKEFEEEMAKYAIQSSPDAPKRRVHNFLMNMLAAMAARYSVATCSAEVLRPSYP